MNKVCICICTYKRTDYLRKLLESLKKMIINNNEQLELQLIVVDNDKDATALPIVLELNFIELKIMYEVESNKGISYARNKCIELALKEGSDFISFVDDDEFVSENWIYELVDTTIKFNADIVAGPVIRVLPENSPNWIKSKMFDAKRLNTGGLMDSCASGNVIFKTQIIINENIRFDLMYSLTGGEDTKFFMKLKKLGYIIIFSDEAIVYEWVPNNRVKLNYILKRRFTDAINFVHIEKELQKKHLLYLRPFKAIIRLLKGLILFIFSFLRGSSYTIRALIIIVESFGHFVGFFSKISIKNY
ncbi:glycosyltransferase family 2 protein [Clostridium estertheticum]|uniref:glycosyltransferase family 2 protein n=1 Tax=Clostridium estertheticum TaxID=238834 RepID=UPI001C0B1B46|nr:glycosyltransferase family 2 protein [Clostridium estertheticum]MBU3200974.1 glycosyltransferase family 2 protein [Clostridium estertheticum]WAG63396.1 glycosyltransferase family 2 protein [Clostridium estertheticum]